MRSCPIFLYLVVLCGTLATLHPEQAQVPPIEIDREAIPDRILFMWPWPSDQIVMQNRDSLSEGTWAFVPFPSDYLTNSGSPPTLYAVIDDTAKDREFFRLVNYFDEIHELDPSIQETNSGLHYEELVSGSGATPAPSDTVRVNYTGRFVGGITFDSGTDVTFGVGAVIPGFAEGLQLMQEGGQIRLHLPSSIGYGSSGTSSIPPYSILIFDVELLEVL